MNHHERYLRRRTTRIARLALHCVLSSRRHWSIAGDRRKCSRHRRRSKTGALPTSGRQRTWGTVDDASTPDIETPSDATSDATPADMGRASDTNRVIDVAPDFATTDAGVMGPILYPIGLTHSPITPSVAAVMRSIAASVPTRDTHSFLKAGDPIMGNAVGHPDQVFQGDFFGCVESPEPMKDLAGYASLQATIDYFHEGKVGGRSPFSHVSRCTRENFTSWDLLSMQLLPPGNRRYESGSRLRDVRQHRHPEHGHLQSVALE